MRPDWNPFRIRMRNGVTSADSFRVVQSPGSQVDSTPSDVGPSIVNIVVIRCPKFTAVRRPLQGMFVAQPDALHEHPADQRSRRDLTVFAAGHATEIRILRPDGRRVFRVDEIDYQVPGVGDL